MELPIVKAEKNELYNNDFEVFKAFANAEIAMSAHVLYEAIDPKFPASISKKVMRIIREDIKFSGLLISDDISMSALSGSLKKRTKDLLEAGNDVVLHCNGNFSEMEEIISSGVNPTNSTLFRMASVVEERKKIEHNKNQFLES